MKPTNVSATGSVSAPQLFHFMGEIEAVFGIWVVPLGLALAVFKGWPVMVEYFAHTSYAEPVFVVVVMAIASSRPVLLSLAEACLARVAALGGSTPAAWWLSHPHRRPAARLLHHRARRDDHLRPAPGPALLRAAARPPFSSTPRSASSSPMSPSAAPSPILPRRPSSWWPARGAGAWATCSPTSAGKPSSASSLPTASTSSSCAAASSSSPPAPCPPRPLLRPRRPSSPLSTSSSSSGPSSRPTIRPSSCSASSSSSPSSKPPAATNLPSNCGARCSSASSLPPSSCTAAASNGGSPPCSAASTAGRS